MLGLPRRWLYAVFAAGVLKIVIAVLVPASSDFVNWINLTSINLRLISNGHLPTLVQEGPYLGLGLFITPFYAIWSILPAPNPTISNYLLALTMRVPILLFDLITGILVYMIAKRLTNSGRLGELAFLLWYLNPFNMYLMISPWNSGEFDIIPTAFVALSIMLASNKRWSVSGLSLCLAALLRIFPIFLFPFLLFYARRSKGATARFAAAFALPLLVFLLVEMPQVSSGWIMAEAVLSMPLRFPWILRYLGFPLTSYFYLTPLLLLVQLYVCGKYWGDRSKSGMQLVLGPLLVLFVSTYHEPYHFIWALPFLTVYCIVNRDMLSAFAVLCLAGVLSSTVYGMPNSPVGILEPMLAGFFFGLKAVYLLSLNLESISPKLRNLSNFQFRSLPRPLRSIAGAS
jgi:hypothetical protein